MKTAVVVPNWNGEAFVAECIDSLLAQSAKPTVIVVDNASVDGSRSILEAYGNQIVTIYRDRNYGFTGGVNPGIEYAIDHDFDAVALLNNDAVAHKDWLKHLAAKLKDDVGIVTCQLRSIDGKTIDSTGDQLTSWGLPYPRNRGTAVAKSHVTNGEFIFSASGGASLYSVSMLREIGLFDDDFFAYYEDVDLSFRAQLAGWKVYYTPRAIAYHRIGATSSRLKDFGVYQTFKNLPWVLIKNLPHGLILRTWVRFKLVYLLFFANAVVQGQGVAALRGLFACLRLVPRKFAQRRAIQRHKKVSASYIDSMLTHDLPENSLKLRRLRAIWWKLRGIKS